MRRLLPSLLLVLSACAPAYQVARGPGHAGTVQVVTRVDVGNWPGPMGFEFSTALTDALRQRGFNASRDQAGGEVKIEGDLSVGRNASTLSAQRIDKVTARVIVQRTGGLASTYSAAFGPTQIASPLTVAQGIAELFAKDYRPR